MKDHARQVMSLVFVPVLTFTLMDSFAYLAPGNRLRAVAAQSTSPSSSYGFVVGSSQIDSVGDNGAAFLGVINFDGAGNVIGTATGKPRGTNAQNTRPVSSAFTGTGSVTLNFAVGFRF